MNKKFIMIVGIGLGLIYLVMHFVGNVQSSDDRFKNDGYNKEHIYDAYKTVDSTGQEILDLTGADESTQVGAWNRSVLRYKFLSLFPNFIEMRHFVNDRLRGKILKDKLMEKIKIVEYKFFSGDIDTEGAKRELRTTLK